MEKIIEKRQESSDLIKGINGDFSRSSDNAEQRISTLSVAPFDSGVTYNSGRDGTGTNLDMHIRNSNSHFGALPIRKFSLEKRIDIRATGLNPIAESGKDEDRFSSIGGKLSLANPLYDEGEERDLTETDADGPDELAKEERRSTF